MRADLFLFSHGLAKSRTHAAALINSGVSIDGKQISKPSENIPDYTPLENITILNPSKFVGRGGYKLEAALDVFKLDVTGMTALDIGASTGGFTDCLLQHHAVKVYATDVGHGQLDRTLLSDRRVISMEGINARNISRDMFNDKIDVVTCDVSFISQRLVYNAVSDVLDNGGIFISLIKPQFEAGKKHLNKNGIVKDRKIHGIVIEELFSSAASCGLYPHGIAASPIEGGDGNREYIAYFIKNKPYAVSAEEIAKTVR